MGYDAVFDGGVGVFGGVHCNGRESCGRGLKGGIGSGVERTTMT